MGIVNPLAGVPSGTIVDYGGATAPSGWLLCYGQAVSRTAYALLFAAIGTAHGAGDGSTTFNLPDHRGRVTAGKDNMGGSAANRLTSGASGITGTTLGAVGGTETHTLTTAQLASHLHSPVSGSGVSTFGVASGGTGFGSGDGSLGACTTSSTGSGSAHQNAQPTIVQNKIIKT